MNKQKKSLGQNFLIDPIILEKIVNIIKIKNRNILEVGPGTGNLTSLILKKTKSMVFVNCTLKKKDQLIASATGVWKVIRQI